MTIIDSLNSAYYLEDGTGPFSVAPVEEESDAINESNGQRIVFIPGEDSESEGQIGPPGKRGLPGTSGANGTNGRSGKTIVLEPELPEEPNNIPGRKGLSGATGTTGAAGRNGKTVVLDPELPDEPIIIPGKRGANGATGNNGAAGRNGKTIFFEPIDGEEGLRGPQGKRGVAGTNGTNGTNGRNGRIIFLEPEIPDDGIPGPKGKVGATGPAGSGSGGSYTAFTQDLGESRKAGTFDITGLSGLTAEKVVSVVQTAAAISSKGNARDEFELDPITLTGYVVNTTTIRVYWSCENVVVGTYAFAYQVSG